MEDTDFHYLSTSESDSESKEEVREPCRKCVVLKSGKVHTADSMMFKKVTWPYELVYTSGEKKHSVSIASVTITFCQWIMDTVKPALWSVMSKQCAHPEWFCRRKQFDAAKGYFNTGQYVTRGIIID